MSTDKETGGPAFPRPASCDDRQYSAPTAGMMLRDYMAIHADLSKDIEDDGCIARRLAIALMGGDPPNWDDYYLDARLWWLEAESRLRYRKADAMLRARSA